MTSPLSLRTVITFEFGLRARPTCFGKAAVPSAVAGAFGTVSKEKSWTTALFWSSVSGTPALIPSSGIETDGLNQPSVPGTALTPTDPALSGPHVFEIQ